MHSSKFWASGLHLLISVSVAILVLLIVYCAWYPGAFSTTEGVTSVLLMMLGIDVVLGPLITLIVYKPKKPSLKFDLAVIGIVQVIFLGYGLHTVEVGRPSFVVFVKDRFESVAVSDLSEAARTDLASGANIAAETKLSQPTYVAAIRPADPKEQYEILISSLEGRGDIAQMPKYYASIEGHSADIVNAALPLAELKKLNQERISAINETIKKIGINSERISFVPLKGKSSDAVVFVQNETGQVLTTAIFKPW